MTNLAKKLETRHINMIALGGSIGTGIFLASGYSIFVGGPGGALLGYGIISVIIYFLMTSLGEMSVHNPSSGSLCDYSTMYVGKSCGFAMGYNYWLSWAITIAAEISASALVMDFWFPTVNPIIFSAIFFAAILLTNILSVRVYGETEYMLSFMKVAMIVVFIVVGSFAVFKQPNFGLNNWHIEGAPFHQGWFGFLSVFLFAGYAFQGTELIGVAAGEAKNPAKAIPKSIKMVFWRLTFFYIVSIAIISFLIPYTDQRLSFQNNINMSPYTLIFQSYFSAYAASAINFIILIALISAANASMYTSTRILWHMGKSEQAPAIFKRVTKNGVPLFALALTALVGSLIFLTSFVNNGQFFACMVQIASVSCFVAWFGIALSHYKFRKNILPALGGDSILSYKARFYPYAQIISMLLLAFIIGAQFLTLPQEHSIYDTLGIALGIAPYFVFYFVHKLFFT